MLTEVVNDVVARLDCPGGPHMAQRGWGNEQGSLSSHVAVGSDSGSITLRWALGARAGGGARRLSLPHAAWPAAPRAGAQFWSPLHRRGHAACAGLQGTHPVAKAPSCPKAGWPLS